MTKCFLLPDAFFYAGTTSAPSDNGFIIPDENGGSVTVAEEALLGIC